MNYSLGLGTILFITVVHLDDSWDRCPFSIFHVVEKSRDTLPLKLYPRDPLFRWVFAANALEMTVRIRETGWRGGGPEGHRL